MRISKRNVEKEAKNYIDKVVRQNKKMGFKDPPKSIYEQAVKEAVDAAKKVLWC